MENVQLLKAIADDTRLKILKLLLSHNYCVRALARKLDISEAAVSQHLKVLKEAGVLSGDKRGYFVHYTVNRDVLTGLADDIREMAQIKCQSCAPEFGGCGTEEAKKCHNVKGAHGGCGEGLGRHAGRHRGGCRCNEGAKE